MFYVIRDGNVQLAEFSEINQDEISVGYLMLSELEEKYECYNINKAVVEECKAKITHFRTNIDVYEDYSFGIINIVDLKNIMGARDIIAFVIRDNQCIFIKIEDHDNNIIETLKEAIGKFKNNATLEKVVFGIFEQLLNGSVIFLETTEEIIMEMEKGIVNRDVDTKLNKDIYEMRSRLSILNNYFNQLVDIGDELMENENDIFKETDLRYFKIFRDKAHRLSDSTQSLSESLIHIREALDASLNYSLNSIMKVFTVVTTIFLPLTLIVGWYGMNFTNMPELTWRYGYFSVIIISISVVVFSMLYFKRKKLI